MLTLRLRKEIQIKLENDLKDIFRITRERKSRLANPLRGPEELQALTDHTPPEAVWECVCVLTLVSLQTDIIYYISEEIVFLLGPC